MNSHDKTTVGWENVFASIKYIGVCRYRLASRIDADLSFCTMEKKPFWQVNKGPLLPKMAFDPLQNECFPKAFPPKNGRIKRQMK